MKRIAPLAATLILLALVGPRPATATHAMPCPDLNGDGVLSVADLAIEASYLGQTVPPAPIQADMDLDGDVDQDDINYLLNLPGWKIYNWSNCQDAPIGPFVAVGGGTELTGVVAHRAAGYAMPWEGPAGLAAGAAALLGLFALRRRVR